MLAILESALRSVVWSVVGLWLLAAVGTALAFTVAPGAINMALGAGFVALALTPVAVSIHRDMRS